MKVDHMQHLINCAKSANIEVSTPDQKTIKDIIITLFDCRKNEPQSKRKLKLIDYHCYSELALYLVKGEYAKTNKTFTLKFSGVHVFDVIIQLQGSGLVFVKLTKTPFGELDQAVVLKTNSRALKPLNGILLHLLK